MRCVPKNLKEHQIRTLREYLYTQADYSNTHKVIGQADTKPSPNLAEVRKSEKY